MTDNEIIKAMQCVIGNDVSCSECEYQKALPFPSCRRMCAKNALDLINRQKAENEMLQDLITYQKQKIKEIEQKYNQAVDDMFGLIETTRNEIAEAKTEAIKEFIDELKNRVVNKYEYTDIRVFKEIDNLVKEMTNVETNQKKEDGKNV